MSSSPFTPLPSPLTEAADDELGAYRKSDLFLRAARHKIQTDRQTGTATHRHTDTQTPAPEHITRTSAHANAHKHLNTSAGEDTASQILVGKVGMSTSLQHERR